MEVLSNLAISILPPYLSYRTMHVNDSGCARAQFGEFSKVFHILLQYHIAGKFGGD